MIYSGFQYLPLFLFFLFPLTFFGCYLAAVLQGHVKADFPYISDTGTYSPESCVFGQILNIGAFCLAVLVYIRYCEVYQYFEEHSVSSKVFSRNKVGLICGLISCIGLSMVANFQETNVIVVHYIGACLCFGGGTIYFWLQAFCSYYMHPLAISLLLAHCRMALAFICTIFYILMPITGLISHLQYNGCLPIGRYKTAKECFELYFNEGDNPRKWYPQDGGWQLHVVSTASEWVAAICYCFYILTFYPEFSLMKLSHPKIFLELEQSEERGERERLIR